MKSDCTALLDACVLVPMPLADTLLRLAESPRVYRPRWTGEILAEVSRTLISKMNRTESQAAYREKALRAAFPEAWVDGYEHLISRMTNDRKDRHVLAAAVQSNSDVIVTYNKKDFPATALKELPVQVKGPSSFLRGLYELEPAIVTARLHEQAVNVGLEPAVLLRKLSVNVPAFVEFFCAEQGLDLTESP